MDKATPTPYSHQGEPEAEAKRIDDYMNNETEEYESLEEALTS